MDTYYNSQGSPEGEEESWWSVQAFTLMAGLGCGMIAHLLVRHFSGNSAPTRSLASMIPHMDNKMVFAVRTDLGMTKGKVAAQCAHAAVGCYKKALSKTPDYLRSWEMFGETKIALKIDSEESIRNIQFIAEAKGLAVAVIRDAGRTQVDPGTVTVVGIGPGPSEVIDSITGHLKLY